MTNPFQNVVNPRMSALVRKEFTEIRRDRRLMLSLLVPPILQLTLFGFALSALVSDLRLGVVDDSKTPESRELVATLTESESFRLGGYYFSVDQLGSAISQARLDAGVVIPYDYARELHRGHSTTVQFLLNATNANTATISQAYAEGIIQTYTAGLQRTGIHASLKQIAAYEINRRGQVQIMPAYIYNPG
ncbi:MAG: ABC transporter permease, partial [Candidatus Sulfotelmatobacter sp.]